MRKLLSAVAVVPALTLCAVTTQAQEAPGGRKQTVFIYRMGAAIDGDASRRTSRGCCHSPASISRLTSKCRRPASITGTGAAGTTRVTT